FVQNDWQNLVPALERGDFDVILNGLEVTPSRRARLAFTRPHSRVTGSLVGGSGRPTLASPPHPAGRPRGSARGLVAAPPVVAAKPAVDIVLYEGDEEPYLDLVQGRLSGVLLDDVIADRHGLTRPDLRLAATVGEGVYAIGLRPGDTSFRAAVDQALGATAEDGELR